MSSSPRIPSFNSVSIIISSPSGAGKTSLCRGLLRDDRELKLSISVTTRPQRGSECDGSDYFFVTKEQFEAMRDSDALLEWAEVFGHFYGTPRAYIEQQHQQGHDVLLDIDGQGACEIASRVKPEELLRLFILPPSIEALAERLQRRAEDSDATIAKRMAQAGREIDYWHDYDYILINRDYDETLAQLRTIIRADRHRRSRFTDLDSHIKTLKGNLSSP